MEKLEGLYLSKEEMRELKNNGLDIIIQALKNDLKEYQKEPKKYKGFIITIKDKIAMYENINAKITKYLIENQNESF